MDLRQLFATNLRRIRHEREISQEGLAHEAGVDRAYLKPGRAGRDPRGLGDHREAGGGAGGGPG